MIKLLHLDDDKRLTELVRVMLKGQYQVISVHDPLIVIELAKAEMPDVMLLDINMPALNGVQLAARIREEPQLRHIPLVAMTANAMYGDREFYLNNHFTAYLAKPVLRVELIQTLNAVLAQAKPALD